MKEHTFELSNSGKEFPSRFGEQKLTYLYPETLEELRASRMPELPEGVTEEQVLMHNLLGQGLHLTIQKAMKDFLGEEVGEPKNRRYKYATEGDIATLLTEAQKVGAETKLLLPGTKRGEGKATKLAKAEAGREQAEKKASAATDSIKEMYLKLPKNARALYAGDLVERGVLTQAEIDELNTQG